VIDEHSTASEIATAVHDGHVSAVEVCRSSLDRIERLDRHLHAFITITNDDAIAAAERIDASRSTAGPLAGVPIALKDNLCTRGIVTTACSRALQQFVPPYDATVVARLRHAGAVIVGKTNCDEFAMGSSTENSAFGASRNPWDLQRTPGGSSGGSAAAVAASLTPVALGSDTGGSIRQPAAMCGIVGLKPTYGRVSRFGLIAFASSLDQIGPLTRTARDAALVLNVLAGPDPHDATSATAAVPDFLTGLTGDPRNVRIGVPRATLSEGVDDDVARAVFEALDVLRSRGATLIDVALPHARYAVPAYYLVATAEASSNLARYDGVRYGHRARRAHTLREMYTETRDEAFGPEVKRRIMLGTYALSAGYYDAYYLKAEQVRARIRQDYEEAFERVDVVAMPTAPTAAFALGERTSEPLQMYLSDVFTVSANLTRLPAVSIPCGFTRDRLPIGLQLTGRMFDESTLLRVADAYERDTTWWKERPSRSMP
jgi:aspartyl-tRNA(Asn)/glutamyl-tRNA(Gln) amidotransferase subunit A